MTRWTVIISNTKGELGWTKHSMSVSMQTHASICVYEKERERETDKERECVWGGWVWGGVQISMFI